MIEERFNPPWRPESVSGAAEIYVDGRGYYICQDFGGEPPSMILPEWYAALETGVQSALNDKDRTNWTKRALIDTGRASFDPEPISDDTLAQLTPFDLRVYFGFQLRWLMRHGEPSVAFSARWGAHWICEPTAYRQVAVSVRRLRELGLIHKFDERPGTVRPTYLYVPGDGTPDPTLPKGAIRG